MSYTRAGNFVLDNRSYLTTRDGEYVLDDNDQRIHIDAAHLNVRHMQKIVVAENGQIEINTDDSQKIMLQKIGIWDFNDKELMHNVGGSKFISKDDIYNPPVRAERFRVQQGALELSNSNIVSEMINQINTTRNYESLQKLVKTNGQMLSQAISVGRVKV